MTFYERLSSLIPFLYINITVAIIAGAVITKLSVRLCTISNPKFSKVFSYVWLDFKKYFLTEIVSQN